MTERKTIARFGRVRGGVRVVDDPKMGYYIVQWRAGRVRRQFYPRTPEGKVEAEAFAQGVWDTLRGAQSKEKEKLTLRSLWEKYIAAVWDSLRPMTQRNYKAHWHKYEIFFGRDHIAEEIRAEDLDNFKNELRRTLAMRTIQDVLTTIKTAYRWAGGRELLNHNRVSTYRLSIAKNERSKKPGEYSREESDRIIAVLAKNRHRSDGWRPWVAVMLAAHQGKRMHQILHLRVGDAQEGEFIWQPEWEKGGKELRQPMTDAALSAVLTAQYWREKDKYKGPWLFYSAHAKKQKRGTDPRAIYDKASLWLALTKAEKLAGVPHLERRAMHGFRRGVAGDILAATGDAKLALDWIGDSDFRQAATYLQAREERMDEAAGIMDARPKRASLETHPKRQPDVNERENQPQTVGSEELSDAALVTSATGPAGIEPATPSCKTPKTQARDHESRAPKARKTRFPTAKSRKNTPESVNEVSNPEAADDR